MAAYDQIWSATDFKNNNTLIPRVTEQSYQMSLQSLQWNLTLSLKQFFQDGRHAILDFEQSWKITTLGQDKVLNTSNKFHWNPFSGFPV